ncbi:MAG: amidohydrolase [Firmicutes bacterium]|nr:amidohydrolase [Bacillota bacterium]
MKLWKNGFFHTMVNENEIKQQMATHKGKIIGFDEEINHLDFDEIIDLKGHHVYPGFVDAHLHLLGYGQKLSRLNLIQIKDQSLVIETLIHHFNDQPLFAEGYFECGITKKELNQISKDIPILLRHNDYHTITTNDAVLKLINQEHSNGVLTEELAEMAMNIFPKHTEHGLEEILKKSIKSLYHYGITGGHSDDLYYFNGFTQTLKVFDTVLEKMPFRAHLLLHHMVLDDFVHSRRMAFNQTPYLQLGAVKMFYDGTVYSKTALMKVPYRDSISNGMRIHSKSEFVEIILKARKLGLTVAIHVIGDQGLIEVLELLKANPPKTGLYDRLIHTPWMDDQAILMMKDMPITLDIQPQFLSSDLPWALDYFSIKPQYAFPWKTLLNNHIHLAGSSDAPVEIPNPLLGIYSAIKRQSDHNHQTYSTHESLTRFEAIGLYTKGANFSTMDNTRGYLKKGFIADFSIFIDDLLKTNLENLKNTLLYETVINEHIVYKRT